MRVGRTELLQHELNLEASQAYAFQYDRRGRDHEHALVPATVDFTEFLLDLNELLVELPQGRSWLRLLSGRSLAAGRFRAQLLDRPAQVPEQLLARQIPAVLPAVGQLAGRIFQAGQLIAEV